MRRLLLVSLLTACTTATETPREDSGGGVATDTAPPTDTAWICAPDDAVCDGVCTAVRFDPRACGDCGTVCDEGDVCDEGTCTTPVVAEACDPDTVASVLAEATREAPAIDLDCSLTLQPDDVVTKTLRLVGPEASGVTVDCQGATIRKTQGGGGPDNVSIASRKGEGLTWERPTDVTIRDCRIEGSVRVHGQGLNGEGEDVQADSVTLGHRERAQQAAPSRILLDGLEVVADGRIPVYVSPGANRVTLRNSKLSGTVVSTVVYLDAESTRNRLVGNTFDALIEGRPLRREVLAVDGSADNVIAGNTFRQGEGGDVFIYRNCGEGGTVRHQEPRRNLITGNVFEHPVEPFAPPVWVGSRGSASFYRIYCPFDDGYPFGSSLDDDDHAKNTVVVGNRFGLEAPDPPITVDDDPTVTDDNLLEASPTAVAPSCAVFRESAAPRLLAEGETFRGRVCREGVLVP